MGEQPATEQSGPRGNTTPLFKKDAPDHDSASESDPTVSTTVSNKKPGMAQAQVARVRALRRTIPTLRSRPTGTRSVEYKGRPRHLVISAIVLTFVLTFIMTVPLLPGLVQIQPGMPAAQ